MDAAVFKKDQKGWVNHLILTKKNLADQSSNIEYWRVHCNH